MCLYLCYRSAQSASVCLLGGALSACTGSASQHCGVVRRVEWLLELMGQLRNLATGHIALDGLDFPLPKVCSFNIYYGIHNDDYLYQ